jgi:hypothetical protein
MAVYTINLTGTPLPTGWTGTLEQLRSAILDSLSGTISSDNVILGQVGGSAPTSDIGPWFKDGSWRYWDGSAYVPALIQFGSSTFHLTFSGTLTANREWTVQDKDGTLALQSDIFTPRATISLSGASPQIDWSDSNSFKLTMGAVPTFSQINSKPGQEAFLVVFNSTGGSLTPLFGSGFHFEGGGGASAVVASKSNLLILRNVAGTIYVEEHTAYA